MLMLMMIPIRRQCGCTAMVQMTTATTAAACAGGILECLTFTFEIFHWK